MGQGGHLLLRNKTPYRWRKTGKHAYQMKSWDDSFPEIIEPGSFAHVYIEWTEGTKNKHDDAGEIDYTMEGINATFQIQARAKNNFEIKVVFNNIPVDRGEISLGWEHDGTIFFTLMGSIRKMAYIASNQPLNQWMAYLPDSCKLSHLSIPGTHDTCTFGINEGLIKGLPNEVLAMFGWAALAVPVIVGLTKCQNLALRQQLDHGIRFLDIRLVKDGDKLEAYHGGIRLHMNFSEVASACYSFLDANKKETIIMSINNEGKGNNPINDMVEAEINRNIKYWCTTGTPVTPITTIPDLGEARQKLVLLRRYPSSKPYGIEARWSDNTAFEEKTINTMDEKLSVQDSYKVPTLFDIPSKWDKVKNQLQRATENSNGDILFLNFTSGSSAGAYPYSIAYDLGGKSINARLKAFIDKNTTERKYGIIPMDFPERKTNLTTAIINSNPFSPYKKNLVGKTDTLKENTVYEIRTNLDTSKCLDVLGYKTENGAAVGISKTNDGKNQQWRLIRAEGDYFYIEPLHTQGMVLDVYLDKRENGAKIAINQKNQGDNQKWKVTQFNENLFAIFPKSAPDYVLDLTAFNTSNSTEIKLYKWKGLSGIRNGRSNQLWYFYEIKSDV